MKRRKTGGKGGTKKPPPVADFARVKTKVGKKAPLPSNATQTKFSFSQIHVPSQNLHSSSSTLLSSQLHLHLSKVAHHNAGQRREALTQLQSLLTSHPSLLSLDLPAVLERTIEAVVDAEKAVRTAFIALYTAFLPLLSPPTVLPFLRLVLGYTCSGLCHLEPAIRRTALSFLSLLIQHYPALLPPYEPQLLPAFLSLLSARLHSSAPQPSQAASDKAPADGAGSGACGPPPPPTAAHHPRPLPFPLSCPPLSHLLRPLPLPLTPSTQRPPPAGSVSPISRR